MTSHSILATLSAWSPRPGWTAPSHLAMCAATPARSIVLAALLGVASIAAFPHTARAIPGDVSGDDRVTSSDASLLRDYLLGLTPLSPSALLGADANHDGVLDVADVVEILRQWERTVTLFLPGDVPLELVRIPAGSFAMGAPVGEPSRGDDEGPGHAVNIEYEYYMGRFEVTQRQWLALMGSWPETAPSSSYGAGNNYPAYFISWNDAKDFTDALNAHIADTGQGPLIVRLPSEAEWEHACRAGTTTRFYFGDSLGVGDFCQDGPAGTLPGNRSDYMWFCGNSGSDGTKGVGGTLPNALGLYDMHGNVGEWCEDWYHSSYADAPADGSAWYWPQGSERVVRIGSWFAGAGYSRSAARGGDGPGSRRNCLGFRAAAAVRQWPTPTPSPTATPTPSPTASLTPTPSPTASLIPTPSPTASPSPTPSPSPTASSTPTPPPTVTPAPTSVLSDEITILLPGDVPLVLVRIPAGSFQMGSPDTERSRLPEEGPLHPVTLGYNFYMGKYTLTQAQWLAVMGSWPDPEFYPENPFLFGCAAGDNIPAYFVSWDDAKDFIAALNAHIASTDQGPLTVRLPSESEWEYACRAGTTTRFYFGDSLDADEECENGSAGTLPGNRADYMWYCQNKAFQEVPMEVGKKLPNAFGLFDMHGNVWEWCEDAWYTSYTGAPSDGSAWASSQDEHVERVLRGGPSVGPARICRSAYRVGEERYSRNAGSIRIAASIGGASRLPNTGSPVGGEESHRLSPPLHSSAIHDSD